MRNLVVSLVEHERISTTLAKAKELRRWLDKAITIGKRGSLADRRLLMSRIPNKDTVAKVFDTLAPRYKDRMGGYTRIYRTDRRPGDSAEMALIELIDAQLAQPSKETTKKAKKAEKQLAGGDKAEKTKERSEKRAAKKEAKAKDTGETKTKKASAKAEGKAEGKTAKKKSSK